MLQLAAAAELWVYSYLNMENIVNNEQTIFALFTLTYLNLAAFLMQKVPAKVYPLSDFGLDLLLTVPTYLT